jgi:hypothetical protein
MRRIKSPQTNTSTGNSSSKIEEEQTMQWPKEKGQRDKQRSTKHYTQN